MFLVCCCKRLNACTHTACQGICKNIEYLLESFLSIYFKIYFSLYFFNHSAHIVADFPLVIRTKKDNLSSGFGSKLIVPFSMPNWH